MAAKENDTKPLDGALWPPSGAQRQISTQCARRKQLVSTFCLSEATHIALSPFTLINAMKCCIKSGLSS